jgi:K+-transporting ATPase A subunit
MKKNMGSIDKVVRILAAIAIIIIYYNGMVSGLVATILLIVAAIFIATSFIGTCPLYLPFGLSTRKK